MATKTIGDITVETPVPRAIVLYIKQDDDVIVVYRDEIIGLADALRECSPSPDEEAKPEEGYAVLKNSNQPQGSQPDDGVTRGMQAFFDCYVKFTRVAKTRGIMEKGERLALFAVYTGRME